MNEKLRKFLEANGLRSDASEQEAWALYHTLQGEGIEFQGDIGSRSAGSPAAGSAGEGQDQPAQPAAQRTEPAVLDVNIQAQIDEGVRRARAADLLLRNEIDDRLRIAGLFDADDGAFRRSIVGDENMTSERAASMIFARLQSHTPPIGAGTHSGFEVGEEDRDKFRDAVTDGLLIRSGHRIEEPAAGHREFRGRSMVGICRMMLERSGVDCRDMLRMQIVSRALTSASTSDLPYIFAALVNKSLLRAYNEAPSTFRQWVAVTSANDFKSLHAIKLSGSPDLKGLTQNGEYQTATFSDSKEMYNLVTKGIKVALTREMIINDDLRALSRIPQLFGVAAKRMENAAVYSLITANGAMSDGTALFHADHSNLAGTGTALGSTSLGVGRAAMRKQTGLNGEVLDVMPAFLLTPVALETSAEVLLRSTSLPDDNKSSGVYNPWAGKLTPVSDPLLDANSATAWYLLAHPNQVPIIEVAYLEGEEQPYVEEMVDFHSDALITKVRHDFGAGKVDHVGGYKNGGA